MTIGAFNSPDLHHLVEREAREVPLAQTQPADARGKALERDPLPGHRKPAMEMRVVREEFRHLAIGLVDVFRIARQRDPAKRSLAFAEERADVGGNEARKRERVRHALVLRDLTDVVAVVEGRHSRTLEREHGFDVGDDRVLRRRGQRRVLRRIGLRGAPALDRPAGRQIAVDEVVRRRLIGDHVGPHAAPDEFRQDLRRVAEQADGDRAPCRARVADDRERVVEIRRLAIEITGCEPHLDARLCWHSTASIDAPAIVAASGCAPPMPPSPAVSIQRSESLPP